MASSPLFPEVLCMGAHGKAVAIVQLLLNGARVGPTERLQVDGDFGPTTRECVKALESRLFSDSPMVSLGIVDDSFLRRFQSISGAASLASLTSDHFMRGSTFYTGPGFEDQPRRWGVNGNQRKRAFAPWLNVGSEGRAVTLLQVFLVGAGFGRGIVFDGQYGSTTAVRVGDLQRSLSYDHPDGNFGQGTRGVVREAYGIDFNTLPLVPFRTNTQWCRRHGEPLQFHPHRGSRDSATSERSRLTYQPAPVLPDPQPLAPDGAPQP